MPLPAGTVRVYQADSHGGALFVGEDRIAHTPKDEDVSIHIGNAFDIVSERKQTDYSKSATGVYEMEYQITLRNHKDSPVTIEVNEPIGGDWQMLSSTLPANKNRGLRGAISCARCERWRIRSEVSRPRSLLIFQMDAISRVSWRQNRVRFDFHQHFWRNQCSHFHHRRCWTYHAEKFAVRSSHFFPVRDIGHVHPRSHHIAQTCSRLASAASMFRIVCTACAYTSPTPTIFPSGPVAVVPAT